MEDKDKKLNKTLIDLANKLEKESGRDGVIFTAEDYEKVKYPESPKHKAPHAVRKYTKARHDAEKTDWDRVIARQARKESAEGLQGIMDFIEKNEPTVSTPVPANEMSAGAMTKQIAMRGEERRKRFEGLKDELRDFRPEITYPPTISNNIPMPVDGGYEDSGNSRVRGSGMSCRADEGFDDLGYDNP